MDNGSVRNWARGLQPYVKNLAIYNCPSAPPRQLPNNPEYNYSEVEGAGNTNYYLNGVVSSRAIAVIPNPADIIFLHETSVLTRTCQVRPYVVPGSNPPQYKEANTSSYDLIHSEGANLLFCDGHAKWQKKTAIRFAQFGMNGTACPSTQTFRADAAGAEADRNITCTVAF